jgi:hypothetical protein
VAVLGLSYVELFFAALILIAVLYLVQNYVLNGSSSSSTRRSEDTDPSPSPSPEASPDTDDRNYDDSTGSLEPNRDSGTRDRTGSDSDSAPSPRSMDDDLTPAITRRDKSPQPQKDSTMSDGETFQGLEKTVEDTIKEIRDELEIEQEIEALDERAVNDLIDALEYINRNGGMIDDLMRVKFPSGNNNVSYEDLEHEMQAIKKSYSIDPGSKQATEELLNEMQAIHEDLQDALEALREKDEALQQIGEMDSDAEKRIEMIDKNERKDLQKAIKTLKSYKN